MRRTSLVLALAAMPALGHAQDAYIRIEAKRSPAEARTAAEGWAAEFPNVVTFPLQRGWTGIALGPLDQATAEAQIGAMKSAGRIPEDSFIADRLRNVTPVDAPTPVTAQAQAQEVPVPAADDPVKAETLPDLPATGDTAPAVEIVAEPAPAVPLSAPPETSVPEATHYIQLQARKTEDGARKLFDQWRGAYPDASLWGPLSGWYALTLGPFPEAQAGERMAALKASGAIPRDSFLTTQSRLGTALDHGAAPAAIAATAAAPSPAPATETPAPATARPPVTAQTPASPAPAAPAPLTTQDIQTALLWAGHYDGQVDGQSGPKTEAAIEAALAAEPGSASTPDMVRSLLDRRRMWREAMGFAPQRDDATGLAFDLPVNLVEPMRREGPFTIFGPRDGSGVAVIVISARGGAGDLRRIAGLLTGLGWVPDPQPVIHNNRFTLSGETDMQISYAEARRSGDEIQGFALIWPNIDPDNLRRMRADFGATLTRFAAPPDGGLPSFSRNGEAAIQALTAIPIGPGTYR